MNRYIKISLLLLLPSLLTAQVRFVNNNATVKVEAGTNIKLDNGSVNNHTGGQINNDGNIYVDQGFVQNTGATYTGGASSWLWFEGGINQGITSDAVVNITQLRVSNGSRVVLASPVTVSQSVDLTTNGSVELGANNLVLSSGASISNYNASSYIITNSVGVLQQEVGVGNVVFPVGNSIYNPATLNNAGTLDNFRVRVEDQVQTGYPVGGVETDGVVGKVWMIDEEVPSGSDVTMTLQWDTGDELPSFDRSVSGISHWVGASWDRSPTWTAATNVGGTSWTQTRSGINSFSPFAVEDLQQDLPVELIDFNAKRKDADEVLLTWATATEINNKGFFVQRMLEGESEFTTIGFVEGNGSSTIMNSYEYLDPNAFDGVSYYRLEQVDFDGTTEYTETRAVFGVKSAIDIAIYPNPTNNVVNVRLSNLEEIEEAQVRILDARGRLVYNQQHTIKNEEVLTLEAFQLLPSAMYMLSIQLDNAKPIMKKIIKE
ncbi:MAG: T9SS type A sorting domain-containing protein [Aureispira sp.]|nr:T9SS type A sorting domain-containing protein [Aureispira sp.]